MSFKNSKEGLVVPSYQFIKVFSNITILSPYNIPRQNSSVDEGFHNNTENSRKHEKQ